MAEINGSFIEAEGGSYAGRHLLIELWGAKYLTDPEVIRDALEHAARRAGATILHSHFHHFGPDAGVSGVVVLAESHISIHTWPERVYAALDVFMCGGCDPHDTRPALWECFAPVEMVVTEHRRGWKSTESRN